MSQTGYTPIQLYRTSTASAVPTAGNLAAGELAINLTDEKLYFKNASGTVTLLASSASASNVGTVTSVAISTGTTGLTVSGSPITSSGTITIGGTLAVANGGTGVTTSTGSGSVVLSTSPTLTTPVLGAASATSITNALGSAAAPSYTFTGDTNTGIFSPAADTIGFAEGGAEVMRLDSTGNLGLGVTPSAWSWGGRVIDGTNNMAISAGGNNLINAANAFWNGTAWTYKTTSQATRYEQNAGLHQWFTAASGTAGNAITFTEVMRIDTSGNLGVGTTAPAARVHIVNATLASQLRLQDVTTDATNKYGVIGVGHYTNAEEPIAALIVASQAAGNTLLIGGGASTLNTATAINFYTASNNTTTTGTLQATITSAGYLEATYSDKVVALGNSGTATTINLAQGNVFTATLTGNCTFTLSGSNANSSRGSSFTLILTNDGTAGRTVAWAGGNFRFPGGAASLSRTTTANAVDIWVFFTPDNGTTWYGNISMKNMIA